MDNATGFIKELMEMEEPAAIALIPNLSPAEFDELASRSAQLSQTVAQAVWNEAQRR